MIRIVFWILSFTFLPWLLSTSNIASAEDAGVLRVGVIAPFSGDAATFGNSIRHGMEIAFAKLDPAVRDSIDLRFEDDALVPVRTVSAFRFLKSSYQPDVVISVASGTSNALAPVAETTGTPLIAVASDPAICRGRKHVVNFWVTPETEAQLLVQELKRRGIRRVTRVVTEHDGTIAVARAMDAEPGAPEVVLSEEIPNQVRDFRPFLLKAKKQDFDGFVVILLPGQVGLFARQAREQRFSQQLIGIETFEDLSEVKSSGGALIGGWFVTGASPEGRFAAEFAMKHPGESAAVAAAGHDIVKLLGVGVSTGALQLTDDVAPKLRQYLHSVKDFTGASGVFSSTDDNRFTLPATVKVVTSNGFEEQNR
ncbi:MAG: ABC transporter substrate-binding protein [Deltaproteobacteria bacterium]|nr:ABC transporter substrate-binding protein [Deltaproteobacteria bacterium]